MVKTPVMSAITPNREPQSISRLLPRLLNPQRDDEAIRLLWNRFSGRLIALAESRLRSRAPLIVNGEDVALKAFGDFLDLLRKPEKAALAQGIANRDHIWRLLARITVWEALDWIEPPPGPPVEAAEALDQVPGREPEPHFAWAINEEVECLLNMLHGRDEAQTKRLRQLARLKMHGSTNKQAAKELGICVAQVELLLRNIRDRWGEYDPRPQSCKKPSGG
jgi:hypothetical protein